MNILRYIKTSINSIPRINTSYKYYQWFVLANIMIGTFMAVLDATIVNVGLRNMMNSFGTSIDKIEWVLTAYLLIFAVMLPSSGWIADHFGYKRTYFLALSLFTFGSFLCALAWNEMILIGFRLIQGIGAGMLMPVGMAIVTREFPPEKRGIALGFWAISAAASVSLGPMIGGYLIDNFSWHAVFNVNVPVGIIGLLATIVIQKEYKIQEARSFDFIGFISMSIFLGFLLLALSSGNSSWNTGGWTSNFILTCFVFSLIGLIIFFVTEFNVKDPIIDLRLFKNFNFTVTNIILFIFGFGLFGSTFLLPYYLQNSLGYTVLQSGMVFLPVGILQAFFSLISGFLSDKINPKIPAFIGIMLLGIGLYLNRFLSLYSENFQIMLPLYIRGISLGLIFSPLSTLALREIPRDKMAQASGLFNVIRQVGGSFGVSVLGTLLTRQTIYHTAMNGQSVNQYDAFFQHVIRVIKFPIQNSTGKTIGDSITYSKILIAQNIYNQSFVQAICDDFMIAGIITFICVIPLLLIRIHKDKNKTDKIVSME